MAEPRRNDDQGPDGRTARADAVRRLDQPKDKRMRLPRFDPEAFGRWSEGIARGMGTANFIVYMTVVIAAWFVWNTLAPVNLRFDPYTFTFLTLILSLQASYAAPLILLAQTRQADRDKDHELLIERQRERMERMDEQRVAAIKNETDRLTSLLEANTDLTRQDKDLTEQVAELTKQIHALLTAR
jgi:uncharacterized membrane protein